MLIYLNYWFSQLFKVKITAITSSYIDFTPAGIYLLKVNNRNTRTR